MAECTKVTGTRANSMALEFILCQAKKKDVDCGKKASVLNGSTIPKLRKSTTSNLITHSFSIKRTRSGWWKIRQLLESLTCSTIDSEK